MEKVEAEIIAVEDQIKSCTDPDERRQLREEKGQLREEKLILLRREEGNVFCLPSFASISF